jgi:hypothetical protein
MGDFGALAVGGQVPFPAAGQISPDLVENGGHRATPLARHTVFTASEASPASPHVALPACGNNF